MGMLPPILIELKANASELHSKIGEASKEIEKLGTDGATHGAKFRAGIKAGMEGAGAAMTGFGAVLAAEGMKGTEATTKLKTAVENAGGTFDWVEPKIHHVVGAMANFGHSSSDTETALARLTDATGNPMKAIDQMGLVADIAARKHISLTDAANMVGKIDVGKGAKALTEFGIVAQKTGDLTKKLESATKDHETAVTGQSKAVEKLHDLQERLAGKTKLTTAETQALRHAHEDVTAATKKVTDSSIELTARQGAMAGATDDVATNLDRLGKKVMGGAAAQADTFGGKIASLKAHMENLAETAGQKVGPALAMAGPIMAGLGPIMSGVSSIMGHFKSAQEAATVATEGLTLATEEGEVAEGIALAPILLIVGALALVGVAAYELATHWSEVWDGVKMVIGKVWDFVKDTFDKITGAISGVIDWVKDHWPLILGIFMGPFGLMIGELVQHWDTVVGFVRDIPSRIAGICTTMWDGIKNAFTDVKNWISDRIGDIVGFFAGLPERLVSAAGDLFGFIHTKITDAKTWVSGRIDDIVGFFVGIPGRLSSAAGDVFGFLKTAITDAKNWVSDRVNDIVNFLLGIPAKIAGLGGKIFSEIVSHIPGGGLVSGVANKIGGILGLAGGGPLMANQLAIVGENGPELWRPDTAGSIIPFGGNSSSFPAGGGTTYVTYNVAVSAPPNADMAGLGAVTVSAIREYENRNGKGWRS